MQDPLERLKAANADLERRDSRLREELTERRESVRAREGGGRGERGESTLEGRSVDRVSLAQETIVRRTGRPVLAIRRNQAQLVFDDPDSVVWKARLERAASHLTRAASAVGRIEVDGHPLSWVGTGWLLSPDTIVTNRHVASEFARRRGTDFVFRPALRGGSMSASIDFIEELERTDSLVFRLERVLHIEDEEGPDISFMRVSPASGQTIAQPIALAETPAEQDAMVAVIGYPARDSRIPDVELMDRIFGNVYDKKRLAPGQITVANRRSVEHDCSTLGGNSGSVVLSLDTGEAVGIHFAGRFLAANFAVPAALIADRLEQIARGGRSPRPSAPPQREETAAQIVRQTVNVPTTPAGSLSWTVPIHLTVQVGHPQVGAATGVPGSRPAAQPLPGEGDEGEDEEEFFETEAVPEDYRDREGYVETFLRGGADDASLDVIRVPVGTQIFEVGHTSLANRVICHTRVVDLSKPKGGRFRGGRDEVRDAEITD